MLQCIQSLIGQTLMERFFPSGTSIPVYILLALIPVVIGYLLGSVNVSIILSGFYRDDIRNHGSGNAGMTNVMRTWGGGAAVITFAGDLLKCAISIALGAVFMGETGAYLAGFAAMLGHVWPLFFGFRGGKGVVAMLGLVLFTEPLCALLLAVVFVGLVATSKFISLGSIIGSMLYPVVLNRIYPWAHKTAGVPIVPTLVSFLAMIVVVAMHRENIQRLMKGKENKFSFKKSVKPGESSEDMQNNA